MRWTIVNIHCRVGHLVPFSIELMPWTHWTFSVRRAIWIGREHRADWRWIGAHMTLAWRLLWFWHATSAEWSRFAVVSFLTVMRWLWWGDNCRTWCSWMPWTACLIIWDKRWRWVYRLNLWSVVHDRINQETLRHLSFSDDELFLLCFVFQRESTLYWHSNVYNRVLNGAYRYCKVLKCLYISPVI